MERTDRNLIENTADPQPRRRPRAAGLVLLAALAAAAALAAPPQLGVTLDMPAFVRPGETFFVTGNIENPGAPLAQVPVFFILEAFGAYYFWPSWVVFVPPNTGDVDFERRDLAAGLTVIEALPAFPWPDLGGQAAHGLFFYGALLNDELNAILGDFDMVEWGYGPAQATPTPSGETPTPTPTGPGPTATATPTAAPATPTPAPTAVIHDVSMVDSEFVPNDLSISVGETVRWTNNGSLPHTSTSGVSGTPDGIWDSGTLNSGQSFSYTFDMIGNFTYFCEFHYAIGMTAIIRVNP